MPVPTSIDQLSATAASNSPAGSDSPAVLDDHLRAQASFIAQLRDERQGVGLRPSAGDSSLAINGAIAALAAIGGGTLQLSPGTFDVASTIVISSPNIRIRGAGGDSVHDGGTNVDAATKLRWTGAAGGTMIEIASVSGATRSCLYGCGVSDLELDANSLAGQGIRIVSHRGGTFENLILSEFGARAFEMTCLVTGTTLAEAADNQNNTLRNIYARQLLRPGVAFWFDGSSNANTSYNLFDGLAVQHKDAQAFMFVNADNNVCRQLRAYRSGSAAVYSFEFWGSTAAGSVGGDCNMLIDIGYPSTYGVLLRGTPSGFTDGPKRNNFLQIDNSNGAQLPVAETGAIARGMLDAGAWFGLTHSKPVIAGSAADAIANASDVTTESLRIHSASADHVRLTDGTSEWGLNIDASTGDVRLNRIAGSGNILLSGNVHANGALEAWAAAYLGGRNGAHSLHVQAVSSAVNHLRATGSVAGGATAYLAAVGSDANVGLTVSTQGGGTIHLLPGGGTALRVDGSASNVNGLQVYGTAAGGSRADITAIGADSVVNVYLGAKGSGAFVALSDASGEFLRQSRTEIFAGGDNTMALGRSSRRMSNVHTRQLTASPPASATPANNGEMVFELTNDATLKVKVKGSDGVVRSTTLTLS